MKLLTCKRGHDTSYAESRDSYNTCKECKRMYQRSSKYNIKRYRRRLLYRIEIKKERLIQYEEEIRNRIRACENL